MKKDVVIKGMVLCKEGLNSYIVRFNLGNTAKCKNGIKGFKRLLPGDMVQVIAPTFSGVDGIIEKRIN